MYKPIGRVLPCFLRLWHAADFWEGITNVSLGAAVGSTLTTHSLYVARKENFYRCIPIVVKRSDILSLAYGKIA